MLKTIDRALRWSTGLMAAMALFSLMWLTLVDVTGRKFFSHSVPGGLEITEILMVIVIFGALPMVSWRSEHVVFDTLDSLIPDWLRDIQARVVHLICAVTFGFLGRLMLMRAERFAEYGDTTVHLQLSIAPVAWLMAGLLALTGLVHLLFVFVKAPVAEHTPLPAAADRAAPMTEALLGFVAVFVMAFLRVPLAVSMAIAGLVGMGLLRGWTPAFASTSQVIFETGFHYVLSVIPLFVLMGNLVARAGMARELFTAANAFVGHRKGGLAMASIIASGGFGSICGSSIATAATMTRVAYPEMKSHGYKDSLATGAIASGGTLGILIPPSTILVIYGIITETDIGKLFVAGILPGLVAITCLCLGVVYVTWRDPEAGPRAERFSWAQRLKAIRGIWGVVVLFGLVIGGIYGGVFTATEGAGVGAAGAFFFALLRGSLTPKVLLDILVESTRTTAMLFTILIAAMIFTNFINFTTMPGDLRDFVLQFSPHPIMVVVMMMGIYLLLGMVMEELAIVLLTIPVFFPVITGLGFDPVWFGILIVTIVEIGMISPPVGLNLFVINSLLPNVKLGTIYRGVWPFVMADIVRLGILIAFPAIALWLPGFMTR